MQRMTKHEFAFHTEKIPDTWQEGQVYPLLDKELAYRIQQVIRARVGDVLVLFDDQQHIHSVLNTIDRHAIQIQVIKRGKQQALKPEVICLIPLLKKEASEQVIYSAVELGATALYLMKAEKSQRVWTGEKDMQRLRAVMYAAAEQAKQFCVPTLYPPQSLDQILIQLPVGATRYLADQNGQDLWSLLPAMLAKQDAIVMAMGPEGDFTQEEKNIFIQHKFIPVRLTQTTLRSPQAYTILLGIFRSLLR